MERVLIFGSTPESRSTARMLRQRGRQVVMSVTSEYARSLLPPGTMCHVGKLDEAGMLQLAREVAPHRIIDATHPYAVLASQNIRSAAAELGLPYEQVHFDNIENAWRDSVEWVDTHEALIGAIVREKGNMLLGIGRDPLLPIPLETDMTRLFPRITPTPEAVGACLALGYPKGNIIAMDGPFSRELTMALFDDKNITGVVVRDATDMSYLHEMVVPALERGVHVIMYGHK
ncbi:MAG: precorrin-6A/cobalt-precorrin-6A reductase [Clostridia bacterium]|nr:precorrin-6A/cobalt-precorrin-6A reductase [Clostridia bacterium]